VFTRAPHVSLAGHGSCFRLSPPCPGARQIEIRRTPGNPERAQAFFIGVVYHFVMHVPPNSQAAGWQNQRATLRSLPRLVLPSFRKRFPPPVLQGPSAGRRIDFRLPRYSFNQRNAFRSLFLKIVPAAGLARGPTFWQTEQHLGLPQSGSTRSSNSLAISSVLLFAPLW